LRLIEIEGLAFDQNFQLRLEIRLIGSIIHRNYVIPFPAIKNHVFSV